MVNRRTFIVGTVGVTVASLLSSCAQVAEGALKVSVLQGSVPAEVLQSFRAQLDTPVKFQLVDQIKSLFQQLQRWQQPVDSSGFSWGRLLPWAQVSESLKPDDLVSLGDYWLEAAIAQNLISPLDIPTESLNKLPQVWQQFVRRDEGGQIETASRSGTTLWAAPYKVQTLVIVYRQSFFPQSSSEAPPFRSWQDLLQPQLRQQIALPDHPRLVFGLLQKLQEGSFNLPIEETVTLSQLQQQFSAPFAELDAQVKTYDSNNSLKALVNEDVKAVVAWSGEVISALRRYQDLRVVVPEDGSLLSADLWVRPRVAETANQTGSETGTEMGTETGTETRADIGAEMSEAAKQWIDFCWQVGPATQISVSGRGISPVFLSADAVIPEALAESLLPVSAIQNSEPLLPLPEALQTTYLELWQALRG